MLPELTIIKEFLAFSVWKQYRDYIKMDDIPRELQGVLRTLDTHHKINEGVDLTPAALSNLFFATLPKDRDYYTNLFNELGKLEVSQESTLELVKSVRRASLLRELSMDSYEASEGRKELSNVFEKVKELEGLSTTKELATDDFEFVTDNFSELLEGTYAKGGLYWRLTTMNKMLGPLRQGDFGFILARKETGKTTFVASEVTCMAAQLAENESVLWLNNEEQGKKVKVRCIQAHFGIEALELFSKLAYYEEKYHKEVGKRILMYDNAVISKQIVEKLCAKYNPKLIVVDQIDKIKGFDGDREDLRLGEIYKWAREIAKTYCPVIGVTQADGQAENVQWLDMRHVSNSKTAKAAEADWILGIGKKNDAGYESIRYLHLSANKLMGDENTDPELRHGRKEVLIKPEIARYQDLHF